MNKSEELENDLLQAAGNTCVDYYLNHHVSEIKDKNELERTIWTIGQKLYHADNNYILIKSSMREIFKVHLYRDPGCIRGWLSYLQPSANRATLVVEVEAESGAKAKNKAITLANKGFVGLRVIRKNYADPLWGINNFPDLVRIFGNK